MSDGPRHTQDGRTIERRSPWRRLRNVWRDIVPFFALALAAYAVHGVSNQIDQQVQGRRVAIDVLCGFGNGVANAGRFSIQSGANIGPARFERNLERLGMPRQQVRTAAAKAAAGAYARSITGAVAGQADVDATPLVDRDGTLDCVKLRALAKAATE